MSWPSGTGLRPVAQGAAELPETRRMGADLDTFWPAYSAVPAPKTTLDLPATPGVSTSVFLQVTLKTSPWVWRNSRTQRPIWPGAAHCVRDCKDRALQSLAKFRNVRSVYVWEPDAG